MRLLVLIVAVILSVGSVSAEPQGRGRGKAKDAAIAAVPSIAVNPSSQLYLGGLVTFDTVYDTPTGPDDSAVYVIVKAFADNGALIWATAGLVGSEFHLGWADDVQPYWNLPPYDVIPAHCVAQLYYFQAGAYVYLARTEFDAAATAP